MVVGPYVIGGFVFQSNGTTAVADVTVTVTNSSTGESHNGNESGFDDLVTNSSGEYSTNLGNFTTDYTDGDRIECSASDSTYGDATETTTVDVDAGGDSDVNLVLTTDETNMIYNAITSVGERADHRTFTTTYDTDSGTIETETATDTTLTMSLQPINEEKILMTWGEVKQGEAIGFFKGNASITKGDLIRIPRGTGGVWWRIQDLPPVFRNEGVKTHFEARLIKIAGEITVTAADGTAAEDDSTIEISRLYEGLGSACSGSDGTKSRVLTITTTSTPFNEDVHVDGMRIKSSNYTVAYGATSLTITFTGIDIWDSQELVVDYKER